MSYANADIAHAVALCIYFSCLLEVSTETGKNYKSYVIFLIRRPHVGGLMGTHNLGDHLNGICGLGILTLSL